MRRMPQEESSSVGLHDPGNNQNNSNVVVVVLFIYRTV